MNIHTRMSAIKPSATMAVTEKAAGLRARGVEVIDFGAGEPDFDTPTHIKDAAAAAMARGLTKYTPVGGTRELKAAIVDKLRRDNQLSYEPTEVIASCGGKHALYEAFQVLFGPGDEVLVPAPFWVSYPDMLALAGASAKIVPTSIERGFKLTPEELDAAITPKTRAIIVNSPSNPAGVAYDEDELRTLGEVIERRGLILISDDVYEMMVYGSRRPPHLVKLRPALRERALVVNSVSKTYAMTGWRLGYTAGPQPVIAAMSKLQGQMTSNPCSIAQAAAAEALRGPQDSVPEMVREFERRRDFIVDRLNAIRGVRCPRPQGAFYVFPNVGAWLRAEGRLRTGDDLAAYVLEKANVALVGGTDFGYADHIRISYATSLEQLQRGVDRMEEALTALG